MNMRSFELLRRVFLLALAYYVTGRLGLQLAIPPGYATAVWPPAGIALAGLLLYGQRLWPGILLGSFAVNIGTSLDLASGWTAYRAVLIALSLAGGASLQAVVGVALIRRFVGTPLELLREQDIAKFFVLAGPASCLISASVGISALSVAGLILSNQVAYSWWTWWVGDSIGATVVAPLLMIWLAEPRTIWRRRLAPVTVPLVSLLAATVGLFLWISDLEASRVGASFQKDADRVVEAVDSTFDQSIRIVRSFATIYETTPDSERGETFADLATRMLATNPEIQALSWNPRVSAVERSAFEQRARLTGDADFRITERSSAGDLVNAGQRSEYVVVLHIEPRAANLAARGFDVASELARRVALERACTTGRAAMTPPIQLVQERSPNQYGVLVFVPVYSEAMPNARDKRCQAVRGFVTAVFRVSDLMHAALGALADQNIRVGLQDASPDQPVVWRDSDAQSDPPQAGLAYSRVIEAAGRTWSISFTAGPAYQIAAGSWRPWVALAGGMLFVSLLSAFLLVVTGKAIIIERLGIERAATLSQINERLQVEISERRQAENALVANEAKLQQAQKMEAIGRLAGGIAHDFNNLLTAIIGYAAMLIDTLGPTSAAADDVRKIQQAGESAARLTQQLLAFSRRQVLQPIVLNVNDEVDRLYALARRLLSEDTKFVVKLASDLPNVKADRGFVEQVLFNLVANARDAMPHGGELSITTEKVCVSEPLHLGGFVIPAGQYVLWSTADDGIGMEEDTRSHIFEPFFSTKGDRGTGLGLATVYGIVKQSGGFIEVISARNQGTTFRIFLPVTEEPPGRPCQPSRTKVLDRPARVLLVEDEDTVRYLVSTVLRRNSYSVIEAGHPLDGLHLARASADQIDLLITDMVMPGMHGRALAEAVTLVHPETRTLFISGYTNQFVESDQAYLQKPFTPDAILRKVQDTLQQGINSEHSTALAIGITNAG